MMTRRAVSSQWAVAGEIRALHDSPWTVPLKIRCRPRTWGCSDAGCPAGVYVEQHPQPLRPRGTASGCSQFGREALFKVFDLDAFTAGITDELMPTMRAAQFPVPLIRASV